MPEDPPSGVAPDTPDAPHADPTNGAGLAGTTRLTANVAYRLSDQARRTASAARAGRVVNNDAGPGVLDLTPLRELLAELVEELGKLRLRDRIAEALRQAAAIIDSRTAGH